MLKTPEKGGIIMPLIEIKIIEGELSKAQSQEVIKKFTDIVASYVGENMRRGIWVVVHEVKNGYWGAGGKALGIDDIRKIQEGRPAA
jgi:4-oxalocrotonate tautomerase